MVGLSKKGNLVGFPTKMLLSPDKVFNLMIKKLYEEPLSQFRVLKSNLNYITLARALARRPKILIIHCHG